MTPTFQPLPDELAPPTLAQEVEFRLCWWIGSAVCLIAVGMFDVWRAFGAARSWRTKRVGESIVTPLEGGRA